MKEYFQEIAINFMKILLFYFVPYYNVLFLISTADLGKCPNGWEERPGSNQCYLITDVHDMRSRDDASAQCQLQQAELVKIESIAERVCYNFLIMISAKHFNL